MNLFIQIGVLVFGLILLVKGADFLVSGASSLAKRLSVSELVIGLTVVAFGTSMPELVVSIFSSMIGYNEIVMGNVIGSNIFNILVILGVAGIIFPLKVEKTTVWKEIPFSLWAVIVFFILVNDIILFKKSGNLLSVLDGIILLIFFILFFVYLFALSEVSSKNGYDVKTHSTKKMILFIVGGLCALFFGGKFVVESAVNIANQLNINKKLIALTIIAGGTSLPELATSTVAAMKKKSEIAVGNIVGSNIFNIFFILSISAFIKPVVYNSILNVDMAVLFLGTIFLFFTMFTGKQHKIDRWEAAIMLIGYFGYISYLIIRK